MGCPLEQAKRIVHGTTVGTNAVLQSRGAKVGLITTKGFRDMIEIGRTQRLAPNSMFKPKFVRPKPLVPRHLRVEVEERTAANGEIIREVDLSALEEVSQSMLQNGVESIAVCFLHSYRNSDNETRVHQWLSKRWPEVPLSLSSKVIPEYREYERFSSTVINAYLMPVMMRYLSSLESNLAKDGYGRRLFIMSSSGGMISSTSAQMFPIRTILSGPAGGVNGAIHFARQAGFSNVITYDMGGTSSDVCLVKDLRPMISTEHHYLGIPVKTLQMEINTVGAGGGSIAWVDQDGRLRVGPKSAGATPGPAAYGKNGQDPTITDANLVLGRLGSDSLLGGKIRLSSELARRAIERLSAKLGGLDVDRLAEGLLQIAVTKMAGAIKEISVEKGHDPRDYVLVPYGGAGPMHAAAIADELGIGRVLVPKYPGNLSALGLIASDVRHDYVRSCIQLLDDVEPEVLSREYRSLEEEALSSLLSEGFREEQIVFDRALDLRYRGQAFELSIPMQKGDTNRVIQNRFHERFEQIYGHRHSEHQILLVNLRVSSFGIVGKPDFPELDTIHGSVEGARKGERSVFFQGEYWNTPIYERTLLPKDWEIPGPVIVEESGATTVIPPQWSVRTDRFGNLMMHKKA